MILVAGDKSGRWETWYREAIPLADRRLDEHLRTLTDQTRRNRMAGEGQ